MYLPSNQSSIHVVIIPLVSGDYYHVYIKYSTKKVIDLYPDESNYDYAFTLPNNKSYHIDGAYRQSYEELRYTAFVSSNETKGNGTYYIAVKLASKQFIII
jgi:hypothetical protein